MIAMIGRVIRDGDGFSENCYCGYGPANPEDQVSQTRLKKERNLRCHRHIFARLEHFKIYPQYRSLRCAVDFTSHKLFPFYKKSSDTCVPTQMNKTCSK